ncbi:putative transposase, IS4 family [Candidatus Nitrososphaera gargensis Ga9.2]|uniref:Putative transposase, IS4 family n=1 Tax=Nitrososphaera gargensis (strain Ga9.2) TaxID=1237085 RepID=K0IMH9_NITGG|nr:hypothetical protein [Candidatus Nitrososphaera gargensis]AFU57909.1 putative transposase, IS4 family [Candidatus Nitrososphaera gargensis Ga9.2]
MTRTDKKFYQFTRRQVKDILTYDVNGRVRYSKEDHLKLLLSACLVNGFAEGVSRSLNRSPTGETLLSYIKTQDREKLLQEFDRTVHKNVRMLRRRRKLTTPVPVAVDWHDIMYYGDPKETPMVIGT